MDENQEGPTTDELFSIVSHPVRRWLLRTLSPETSVPIDTLAEQCINDGTVNAGTSPRQMALSLQHTHLPRLAQAGFIEVDEDVREVALRPEATNALEPAVAELDALSSELNTSSPERSS